MKKILLMTILMIAAIVLGALIGESVIGVNTLEWLAYSKAFSFEPGTFVNVDVFSLTFGFSFKMNVAQLILMLIGIFIYYKIAPKLVSSK